MILQNAVKIFEDRNNIKYLVSFHRHDYVSYTFKDGSNIFLDGGCKNGGGGYYYRSNGDLNRKGKCRNWFILSTSKFQTICNRLLWGTRGKNGDEELKCVLLKDCSKYHLKAILKTQPQIKGTIYEKVIKYWLKTNK